MQAQIILGFDSSVAFSVDAQTGVSFEEAKARLQALEALLGQAGIPLVYTGEVERHVHHHAPQAVQAHA